MKGLPERREHLETFLNGYAPPENGQHFPQGPPRETDSDISTLRLCSAYGQANNLVPHKVKAKATNKIY